MMPKTQDPPPKNDESAPTGKGEAEIGNPGKSSPDRSEDMSADELAAFEKIMSEIDSQEEEKSDGNAKDSAGAEKNEQTSIEDEPVKSSDAIESTNRENRTAVDAPDSANAAAVPATDAGDESLDEDQQRAFESIMAQIESGGLAEAELSKETGDAPETESADDGAAESGKGVMAADTTESSGSLPGQADASDDGLDQEQQQALESIMAQIEADGAANDQATGSEEATMPEPEAEPVDDLAGDPEKGVQDGTASNLVEPANAPADPSTDAGLDQDQQQALESIMAQIEGESAADTATGSGTDTGGDAELEDVEGRSAELEKAGRSADPAEHNETDDPAGGASDDLLSEDQHQAFESIMAQIEGGETDPAAPEPKTVAPTDSRADQTSEAPAQPSVGQAHDESDASSEDISDDIEEILTEIASSEDPSDLPDTDADDQGSVSANATASKKTTANDDGVASQGEDSGLEQAAQQAATPAVNRGKTTVSVEKQSSEDLSSDLQSTKKPTPTVLASSQKPEPLREAGQSSGGKQKKALLASVVVIVGIALAGYLIGVPQRMVNTKADTPDTAARQDVMTDNQPSPQAQNPVIAVQGESDQSRLKTAAENLDRLRNQLIQKQSEIEDLRAYYQAGIDAEIQGIVDRVGNTGPNTVSFKSAMADPNIRLGLSAIQRRDTYIKKLEVPINILFRNSEALLFWSRKSALLAMMAEKTSDIDIDRFIKQADEIRNEHGRELAQLNIDAVAVSPRPLESIWKEIAKRRPTTSPNAENNNRIADKGNATIWKNICRGDFSQKHEMTDLSPEAARCLVEWKGKDLFLSGLTDLSPGAARHLADWEGDWLGLNGLKVLSPEAAGHLARWKGKGLSLNGLSRLSPRVVAIMSDWQGDQIELVNVKHMAHWENPKTRLFLSEDMKHKLRPTRK